MTHISRSAIIIFFVFLTVSSACIGGYYFFSHTKKTTIARQVLSVVEKTAQLLPIQPDTKKAIETANALAQEILQEDGVVRTYLILLQNNMELRPGGGFLGQYAILKIKDGTVQSLFIEDANLLDQRIIAKVTPPYPFRRMMQIKKWKFRDSNFSADFPTNVKKADYFYRLSGGWQKFDGTIAVNADVLNSVLKITGPIQPKGYSTVFSSDDAAVKLEEIVEKAYLGDDVSASAKEQRKNIMKQLGTDITSKLVSLGHIPQLIEFGREQMENKNIMLNFRDETLQSLVEQVHWDGKVEQSWNDDYLMTVDANMGALKSDYYMRRSIQYHVDLTGEKPTATLTYTYKHTATHGDWRTSDYHAYLRVYVPDGSVLLERKNVGAPITNKEFGKTYFGFIAHTVIGKETQAIITYELPDRFKNAENYRLLIQKQSGVQDVPVDIFVKTLKGEFSQQGVLKKDLKYEFKEN